MNLTPVQYTAEHNGYIYKFTYVDVVHNDIAKNQYWIASRRECGKVDIPPYTYLLLENDGFVMSLIQAQDFRPIKKFKTIEEAVEAATKA